MSENRAAKRLVDLIPAIMQRWDDRVRAEVSPAAGSAEIVLRDSLAEKLAVMAWRQDRPENRSEGPRVSDRSWQGAGESNHVLAGGTDPRVFHILQEVVLEALEPEHLLDTRDRGVVIQYVNDPDLTPAYINKAINQVFLNRLDEALLTVRGATERKLQSGEWFTVIPYFVAYLKGDDDELRRTATAARKIPVLEDTISHLEALALARSGRLRDARQLSAVPVEIAQRSGRLERAGLFAAATAVWEAFYGNAAAARHSATKALDLGRGRQVDSAAAFALALAGDLPQSRALAEDLARQSPEETFVQFMYLPTLRALFALNTHDASAAIQTLQTASRYDLALGGVGFIGRFGGLYPVYVRGLAYLAARQPAEAAAEFQRILDHRSIVPSSICRIFNRRNCRIFGRR